MRKISVLSILPIPALAFAGICLSVISLPAQAPPVAVPVASATITFANDTSITIRGRELFRRIGILPGEIVNIQLQLPSQFTNTVVAVQAMDGGVVSGDVTIAVDGTGSIVFQSGMQPGLYRILLSARGRSAMLQFWVPNS